MAAAPGEEPCERTCADIDPGPSSASARVGTEVQRRRAGLYLRQTHEISPINAQGVVSEEGVTRQAGRMH